MAINQQLKQLYLQDVEERKSAETEAEILHLEHNTAQRLDALKHILPTIDNNEIWNCHYLAYLLHHGTSIEDYQLAHDYAKQAVDMGSRVTKWLYAATLDRYLVSLGKKQKFGTQYTIKAGKKVYFPTDNTISEQQKRDYGVVTDDLLAHK